jgi:siroheme synthase
LDELVAKPSKMGRGSSALVSFTLIGGVSSGLRSANGFSQGPQCTSSLSTLARNLQRSSTSALLSSCVGDDITKLVSRLSSDAPVNAEEPQVYIIGTGLSTQALNLPLSTLAILSKASVVLHDNLSLPADEIRRVVPEDCIVRGVGKRGDDKSSIPQSDIDTLLIEYAKEKHPTILRLKGGDPFLFGRSRTEIEALRQNNISYRVIPNLSSSVAGPHYAGIPLTDPLLNAQSFAVFSGTNADGVGIGADGGNDWGDIGVDTLIFLMIGRLDKLEQLSQRLAGSSGVDTPCAIVQSAGRDEQKVWRATLGTVVESIRTDLGADCTTVSPAIFVVGNVASLDLKGV